MIDAVFLLYFVAGLIQDFMWTLNVRFIDHDKSVKAAVTSFLGTVITVTVLYNILNQSELQESIVAILIYAGGVASGTLLGLRFNLSYKGKDIMGR